MSKKNNKPESGKKKGGLVGRWLRRLFFPNKELDIYAEEALQSPGKMVVQRFFAKPLAVVSLVLLLAIMLFVFVAPNFVTLDLGEQDSTLVNVSPGYSMMSYPSELVEAGVSDISVGSNFSVGIDVNGKVYVWGKTRVSRVVDVADIPQEVLKARIVDVAAGSDHIVAVDDKGAVYAWGNARLGQTDLPTEIKNNNRRPTFKIAKIFASNQFSAVLTDDNRLFLWGNANFADLEMDHEKYDGHVVDAALTETAYVVLTDTGSVEYAGGKRTSLLATAIPEGAGSGVVALASTANSVAALKEDGSLLFWGVTVRGESTPPAFSAKPIVIEGGRYHYTAVLKNGDVVSWGQNRYGQIDVPKELAGGKVRLENVFTGYYQNYALDSEGKLHTWGLRGFLLGSDDLGRDIFARLVNGGKMTMTIGALSVVISTIIGIVLGGIAGYFGGFIDMAIMRVAEVVSSMPFIPFAMILSAVLGSRISVEHRMYIIMVILGLLSWPGLCRQVRAQMFAQREMEYVTAAKTIGVKEGKIIFKHIVPNVMSVVLVSITLSFGTSMLTESTLSYLGFGIPAPTPTWGNMLSNANNSVIIQNYWWNWVFVGLIFGLSCVCINLIGDGLRDALDPKSGER